MSGSYDDRLAFTQEDPESPESKEGFVSATRERFETWARGNSGLPLYRPEGEDYEWGVTLWAWTAWQAATEGQQELVEALREAGNRLGRPEPAYHSFRMQRDNLAQTIQETSQIIAAVLARYGKLEGRGK